MQEDIGQLDKTAKLLKHFRVNKNEVLARLLDFQNDTSVIDYYARLTAEQARMVID